MKPQLLKALVAGAAASAFVSPAIAASNAAETADTIRAEEMFFVPVEVPPPASASATSGDDSLDDAPAISDEELDGQRGGQTIQITNQTMTAITSGNILNGDYLAGDVTLSDNALSNFNGIGNLLINTGAQVSLQTGMNFTINVGD